MFKIRYSYYVARAYIFRLITNFTNVIMTVLFLCSVNESFETYTVARENIRSFIGTFCIYRNILKYHSLS